MKIGFIGLGNVGGKLAGGLLVPRAWAEEIYRFTVRLSRQVLRFFLYCSRKRMSRELIEAQLGPLLHPYL